jgi:hypothetical protein
MTDCEFNPPVVSECPPSDIEPVEPTEAMIDVPLLNVPCIPSFSGEVGISGSGTVSASGSSTIRLERDPNSECGFRLSGNISMAGIGVMCVIDADAFVDTITVEEEDTGPRTFTAVVWFNIDGTKTKLNGVDIDLSGYSEYDPEADYIFKFWKCHDFDEPPDKTVVLINPEGPTSQPGHKHDCSKDVEAGTVSCKQVTFKCDPLDAEAGWFEGGAKILVTAGDGTEYFVEVNSSGGNSSIRLLTPRADVKVDGEGFVHILSEDKDIKIDLADLTDNATLVKFREIEVCDGSVKRKCMVLASELYD